MAKISKEQIATWKNNHPNGVFEVVSADGKKGYLKAPSRDTISYATSFLPKDMIGYTDTLLQNCWLGGDDALRTETKYLLGIAPQIDGIVEHVEAEIKKL